MPQTHDIDGLIERLAEELTVLAETRLCIVWYPTTNRDEYRNLVLEALKPMIAEREGLPVRAEDLRLVSNIKWRSDDKDNMEFVTRASTFQVEALRRIVAALTQSGEGL